MGAQAGLLEQDRQRIGLFPGGAAGDPNPDRIVDITIVDQFANDRFGDHFKHRGITKEARYSDQDFPEQQLGFIGQQPKLVGIFLRAADPQNLHPAPNAAQHRAGFILPEIAAQPAVEDRADRHEMR